MTKNLNNKEGLFDNLEEIKIDLGGTWEPSAEVEKFLEGEMKAENAKIANNILELVGNTPLVRLNKLAPNLVAKLEYFNPSNSVKDRVAIAMIEEAEKKGLINPKKTTIIEPSSGNTAIGLAMVCAIKGYKLIIVMHDRISPEYHGIIKAYGGEVVLTDGLKGTPEVIRRAYSLLETIEDSFMPQQFENSANIKIHEQATAKEIWEDTNGQIDFIVAGVGTGGTITGLSSLKKLKPELKLVAVEPAGSPILSGGCMGIHKIQGIGSGFIPKNMRIENMDAIITVTDEQALNMTIHLARQEGILGSISAGAACYAALELAKNNPDKLVLFIIPSSGERQLSSILQLN